VGNQCIDGDSLVIGYTNILRLGICSWAFTAARFDFWCLCTEYSRCSTVLPKGQHEAQPLVGMGTIRNSNRIYFCRRFARIALLELGILFLVLLKGYPRGSLLLVKRYNARSQYAVSAVPNRWHFCFDFGGCILCNLALTIISMVFVSYMEISGAAVVNEGIIDGIFQLL